MITKTYKSDMDVRLSVKGKEVHFTNGYWFGGERQQSTLETSDEDVMYAIEHNSLYGNRIHCVSVVKTEEANNVACEEKEAETEPVNEVVESSNEEIPTTEEAVEVTTYEEPTTVKEAMSILMVKPYEMKASQCSTKEKVRAAEKKFNISFPNVK